jgi:hypothetical protein
VQERAGDTLELIGIGNNFLNRTPMDQQLTEKIDKWDYMKLKSLSTIKELVTRLKREPQNERKTLLVIYLRGINNKNTPQNQ